jgi:RNA polymerase sigma factor (sigma-70 family)
MADGRPDPATEAFLAHRNLLFTVAYEMLGSAADAEDVLQETWLRWAGVDLGTVRDQRAYLVRITTRQALTRLRTLGRRKESYVGPWLPEPLLTTPDVAEDIELADSVSMAMLLVLETLMPTERAVFVLREVFDVPYEEIAEAVGKSPAAVRQIARRARDHVAARRPRGVVSATETRHALEAFQRAAETGDLSWGPPGWAACCPSGSAGSPPRRPCDWSRPRSTATRRSSSGSTARSTPSWRCASTTASSPGCTRFAIPRSCHTWSGKPPCAAKPNPCLAQSAAHAWGQRETKLPDVRVSHSSRIVSAARCSLLT